MMLTTRERIYAVVFAGLSMLVVARGIWWTCGNGSIRGEDSAKHLLTSIECYQTVVHRLSEPQKSVVTRLRGACELFRNGYVSSSPLYPFFVYHVTGIFYALMGQTLFAAKMSMVVFLVMLCMAVYRISRQCMSLTGALLAVYFMLMYPLIFESARQYGFDMPLTAMVSVAIAALLESRGFMRRRVSLLWGCTLGIGMLIKLQFLVFMLFPVLYVYLKGNTLCTVRPGGWQWTEALRNMIYGLLLASAISALWWWPHRTIAGLLFRPEMDFLRIADINIPAFKASLSGGGKNTRILSEKMGGGDISRYPDSAVQGSLERVLRANDFAAGFDIPPRVLIPEKKTPGGRGMDTAQDVVWATMQNNLVLFKTLFPTGTSEGRLWSESEKHYAPAEWAVRALAGLTKSGISLPGTLLFLCGSIMLLTARGSPRWFFIGTVSVPLVIFACMFNYQFPVRHLMPILPLMAVISAWAITSIVRGTTRSCALAIITAMFMAQYALATGSFRPLRLDAVPLLSAFLNGHPSIPWVGFTDYADVRHAVDEYGVRQLTSCLREQGPPGSGVLLIDLTDMKPDPVELRYRCKQRMCDVADLFGMSGVVKEHLHDYAIVVLKVPRTARLNSWPSRDEWGRLMRVCTSHNYLAFSSSPDREIFLQIFETERRNFILKASLPAGEYAWVIFQWKQRLPS